jgi:hypothetical protein
MTRAPWKRCTADQVSSYQIVDGGKAITFHPCGVTSPHPEDVKHRFCAYCDRFIEEAYDAESHLG